VTDIHASGPALEWTERRAGEFNAIIVGGDLAGGGKQEFIGEYLRATLSANKNVFYVQGNADSPNTPVPDGIVRLHGSRSRIGDYSIGGLGGSNPTPFGTPFELDDGGAASVLTRLGRVDILVSHCPPLNSRCDRAGTSHIGSKPVREYVLREKPLLVLSGHAHDSRAIDKIADSTIVNAGPLMKGNYVQIGLDRPISVELKNEKI